MHRLFVTPSPARRSFAELVFAFGFVVALLLGSAAAEATRIKELASVQGVRTNALTGYGLVVGLEAPGTRPRRPRSRPRACRPCCSSSA